ncbi:MAG: phosphatidate cytidylyltransferase [Anaerolineaceae bacterium]|nr:phosphatidate cytidylyltransferase [Anaerolineaceae bacterium]
MKARILSACILVPVIIGTALIGGLPFLAAVLVICGISAWEFGRIFDQHDGIRTPLILLVVSVLILILARWFSGIDASHRTLTFCIMGAMLCGTILCEHEVPKSALSFVVLTTGMVYIGWLGGYMISLRQLPNGEIRFLLVMFMVWANDVGAFFVGRAIGKHKMFRVVSPKKTWEGFFGGIIFTMLIAFLAQKLIPHVRDLLGPGQMLILAAAVSVSGPLGDYGESMIKRCYGVKDSSNLIPGHGGFFDRFDSCFFAMPVAYYIYELIGYL